jgi:DNA polymerase III subunit gamma/tau
MCRSAASWAATFATLFGNSKPMSYQVLARKWRPRTFEAMVGQSHVLRPLNHALTEQRLHHAYLFTGTRGIGKTSIARILAKCLNCETGITATPCQTCTTCLEIDEGRFVDLIEVDAASRTKVEDTRDLLDNVQYAPSKGRFKIYLIDEVHMLSTHSFNALLKTLEEPPAHVKFLLATTDPQRLPVTILSRCLQFNLKALSPEYIRDHLVHILTEEKINYDKTALLHLARAANGSVRDALSLLDQAIAFGQGQVTQHDVQAMLGTLEPLQIFRIVNALIANDAAAMMKEIDELAEKAADFAYVLEELLSLLHRVALAEALPGSIKPDDENAPLLHQLVEKLPAETVQLYYQIALIGRRDLPLAPSLRTGFEMVLLRMLSFQPQTNREEKPAPLATPSKKTSVEVSEPVKPRTTSATPSLHTKVVTPTETTPWSTLLSQLKLTGFSLSLASHCILKQMGDDQVELLLDPAHATLLN